MLPSRHPWKLYFWDCCVARIGWKNPSFTQNHMPFNWSSLESCSLPLLVRCTSKLSLSAYAIFIWPNNWMLVISLLHICTLVCPVAWCKEISIKALMYQKGCLCAWIEVQELDLRRLLKGIAYNLEMKPSPTVLFWGREGRILIDVAFWFRCKVVLTPWTRRCFHRSTCKWSFLRFPLLNEWKIQ